MRNKRNTPPGKRIFPAYQGGKRGRPRFSPTDRQRQLVEHLAAVGIRQEQIARLLENPHTGRGIDPTTLRIHFREELDGGAVKASFAVLSNLYQMATGRGPGAVSAAIFWAKTRCGWRESPRVDAPATASPPAAVTDLSSLSSAELESLYEQCIRPSVNSD